jgi:PadR family transcriptional regulator PadR
MTATTGAAVREIARPSALLREIVLLTAAHRPCHGYELARALGDWRPTNMGQLYRLLAKLEAAGLLHSQWEHSGAGPSRRVYSLTATGEVAVGQARAAFRRVTTTLDRYTSRYQALRGHPHRRDETFADLVRRPVPAPSGDQGGSPRADSSEIVRGYLKALEAKRLLPASATELKANLVLLEALAVGANPDTRHQVEHRRQDLLAAAAEGSDDNLARAEGAFIAVARTYSDDHALTATAWAEAGVEPRVLQAAGIIGSERRPNPAQVSELLCPKPLLRAWLLLLVAEAPRHGYDLCGALAVIDAAQVHLTRIYRVLHHLESDSLVASQWEASTDPAPERRVYSLTPAGEEALDSCAASVVELICGLRRCTGVSRPGAG